MDDIGCAYLSDKLAPASACYLRSLYQALLWVFLLSYIHLTRSVEETSPTFENPITRLKSNVRL